MDTVTTDRFTELQFIEKQVAGYSYNDCLVSLLNLPNENTHLRVNHFIKNILIDEVYGDSEDPQRFNTLFIPLTRDVDVVFKLHSVKLYHNEAGPLTITDGEVHISTNPIIHVELYVGTFQKVEDVRWGEPITLPLFAAQFSSVYLRVQYESNLELTELAQVQLELDVGFVQTRVRSVLLCDMHHSTKWSIVNGLLKPHDSFVRGNIKTSVHARRPIHWLPNGKIKILSMSPNWCVCNYRNIAVEADADGYYSESSVYSCENFNDLKMHKRRVDNDINEDISVHRLETFMVVYIVKNE